jgi:hypothetical protein
MIAALWEASSDRLPSILLRPSAPHPATLSSATHLPLALVPVETVDVLLPRHVVLPRSRRIMIARPRSALLPLPASPCARGTRRLNVQSLLRQIPHQRGQTTSRNTKGHLHPQA